MSVGEERAISVPPMIDPTAVGAQPVAAPPARPRAVDPTSADRFFYGWRYVRRRLPNGMATYDQVPQTEWDVLHPREDDHIMVPPAHQQRLHYLHAALLDTFAGREDVVVFCDMRVDWEVPGMIPHGPDLSVFDGLRSAWDPDRGAFLVKRMNARPLLVIEVTSPSTRTKDLNEKVAEYHRAGVPFYLIVDRREEDDGAATDVIGFRNTPEGYIRIPADPDRGIWIPSVRVWFRIEAGWAQCLTAEGATIPERADPTARLKDLQQTVETEQQTARQERERADREKNEEKQRADREAQRADDLERQLSALREQLARRPPAP